MQDLKAKYLSAIANAADESALEDVRLAALGKKGEISALMATLGKMEADQRKVTGAALNLLKDEIDAALRAKKAALGDAALDERLRSEWLVGRFWDGHARWPAGALRGCVALARGDVRAPPGAGRPLPVSRGTRATDAGRWDDGRGPAPPGCRP